MLFAFVGVALPAIPRVEIREATVPATRAAEKARLFIIMIFLPSRKGRLVARNSRRGALCASICIGVVIQKVCCGIERFAWRNRVTRIVAPATAIAGLPELFRGAS
jgi:hypothetical protein